MSPAEVSCGQCGGGARASRAPVWAVLGGLCIAACGAPEEQIVARESSVPVSLPAVNRQRERVTVVDGELRSDIGTPLRGLLLPADVGWRLDDFGLVDAIADTTGLNTVHVYLENWSQPTGTRQDEADALVSLTAQAGLYLVLGIGGGPPGVDHPGNGWFDIEKVRSFWTLYAARYKDSPHVVFEIQNNPETLCASPMQAETIAMEREAYGLIRSLAPDTHIVLFSTSSVPEPPVLSDAIQRVADVVDWSNASMGLHADGPCVALADFDSVLAIARSSRVPLVISQLPIADWAPYVAALEQYQLGWFHLNWFAIDPGLPSLMAETTRAGIGWCPDRGTFPWTASTCRTP